jgi:hypothetical protein
MPQKGYRPEEIIAKLREAEVLLVEPTHHGGSLFSSGRTDSHTATLPPPAS